MFSGTACASGEAQAVVTATGMGSELSQIAALSATGWPRRPAVPLILASSPRPPQAEHLGRWVQRAERGKLTRGYHHRRAWAPA